MKIFLLLVFFISSIVAAQDACERREDFYKSHYLSSLSNGFQTVQLSGVDILLVGEPHKNFGNEIYPKILNALKVNNFKPDCLFLEHHKESEIDSTLSYFNTNSQASAGMRGRLKSQLFPGTYDWVINFYNSGVKLFAVDNQDIEYNDETLWLNQRDSFMSKIILNLFESGQCRRAIYPVGALHVTKIDSSNQNRVTLKSKLERKGYSVMGVNLDLAGWHQEQPGTLDHTGQPVFPRLSTSWIPLSNSITLEEYSVDFVEQNMVCEKNPRLPDGSPRVYMTSDLTDEVPITFDRYSNKFVGDMRDFSLSISFSCESTECISQNKKVQSDLERKGYAFY